MGYNYLQLKTGTQNHDIKVAQLVSMLQPASKL